MPSHVTSVLDQCGKRSALIGSDRIVSEQTCIRTVCIVFVL